MLYTLNSIGDNEDMILADYPINDRDADKLKRFPLAGKVAEMVTTFKGSESFVVGIEGVWGSGKTSFINLVEHQLDYDKVILVKFNPWNFQGQNELITDFFDTIISKIAPQIDDKSQLKKIKSVVSKLTKKGELAISPEVTAFWGLVNFKANNLLKFNNDEKTLEQERSEIDKLFENLGKKVVIVIDDIDRLDSDETRLVMKLVKMTANFPNTVFLLAYDRARVAERLDSEGVPGEDYLKKIIQVSFTLPKADEQGLKNILYSDLDRTIENIYGEVVLDKEEEQRWSQIVYHGFNDLFVTVRDIKRYISSLALNWSIMGADEVNKVDFITIEAIRVFFPEYYSVLAGNKNILTDSYSYSTYSDRRNEDNRERYKELLHKVPEDKREMVDKINELPRSRAAKYQWSFIIR